VNEPIQQNAAVRYISWL